VPQNYTGAPESWPVVVKWADPNIAGPMLETAGLPLIKAEICADQVALDRALLRYARLSIRPLVQQYARGQGLGQMFLRQGTRTITFFQHQRINEWPPEGGVSTWAKALPAHLHQEQRAKSEALLSALDWQGPAMVEYRYDAASGEYILMEINGRFWGSLPLASQAGAEFAWDLYRARVLGDSSMPPPYRGNIHARYMIPESKRLFRVVAQGGRISDPFFRRRPLRDILAYLAAFFDPRGRYYVFDLRDPMPFFADLGGIIRKALRRGTPATAAPPPAQSGAGRSGNNPRKA
jgi:predicted ATP-grasp superfamily ATP-dependent carboligase